MKRVLTAAIANPIVQFFAAGAIIFALDHFTSERGGDARPEIVITAAEQQNLAALFQRTWGRPPTDAEMEGLVNDRLREELLYREALALGLDQGDVIVRRRMAQKMTFVFSDAAAQRDPTEKELAAFFAATAERYRVEPILSFRHVFFNAEKRGDAAAADAEAALAALAAGSDPSGLGDPSLLPPAVENLTRASVSRVFGKRFTDALEALAPGKWSGPVRSSYGLHLVYLDRRTPGRLPELSEVRERVAEDWREAERRKAQDAYLAALKESYAIRIEATGEAAR